MGLPCGLGGRRKRSGVPRPGSIGLGFLLVSLIASAAFPASGPRAAASPLPPYEPGSLHPGLLNVEIHTLGAIADVGVPFPMNATVSGAAQLTVGYAWTDSQGDTGFGPNFTWTPSTVMNATVTVFASGFGGSPLSASAFVEVVSGPTVLVHASPPMGEIGIPIPVALDIRGGCPPFVLRWSVPPAPLGNLSQRTQDGTVWTTVTPTTTGPELLTTEVTDYWGTSARSTIALLPVAAPPAWRIDPTSLLSEVGVPVALTGDLLGGAPPFNWSIIPSESSWNDSRSSGMSAADGALNWSGSFEAPGNVSLSFWASDAAGGEATALARVHVLPALAIAVEPGPGSTDGAVSEWIGRIVGGMAPYDLRWVLNGTVLNAEHRSTNGSIFLNLTYKVAEDSTLIFEVADSMGVASRASAILPASPVTAPIPGSSAPGRNASEGTVDPLPWIITGISGALSASLFVVAIRHSRRPTNRTVDPQIAADEVVRRLLEGSPGLARGTIESLATEEGISREGIARAIDRWRGAGRIRSEDGWEGEPTLVWESVPESRGNSSPDPAASEGRLP